MTSGGGQFAGLSSLTHQTGDIVRGVDVADGPRDLGWPCTFGRGLQDRSLQPARRVFVGGRSLFELGLHRWLHVSRISYGRSHIMMIGGELSSCTSTVNSVRHYGGLSTPTTPESETTLAVSKRLRHEIFRRDNHTCQSCGAKAPNVKLEPDHVIPVALGGSDDPSNLQTLCEDCNAGKSATPPDAATVAKVAEDALRWSRAIDYAATLLLSDQESRQEKREQFLANWRRWHWGSADDPVYAPLPATWEKSVDQILAAGLPVELLKDCIDTAFAYEKVKPENKFKYTCGVAWRKLDKMRDIAKSALNRTDPTAPRASGGTTTSELSAEVDHLLTDLFDLLTADEHKLHDVDAVRALTLAVDEDGDFPIVTALDAALSDMRSDLLSLSYSVDRLLRELPDGVGEQAMKLARTRMFDRLDPEQFTRHRFSEWAIRDAVELLRARAAKEYLDRLPPNEREAWMQYAETVQSTRASEWGHVPWQDFTDDNRLVHAAHHARLAEQHLTPPRMCLGPGEVIDNCPRQAVFRVLVAELDCCSSATSGDKHGHPLCEGHLELLLAQGYLNESGDPLTVRDYWEMEAPDPEEPPF